MQTITTAKQQNAAPSPEVPNSCHSHAGAAVAVAVADAGVQDRQSWEGVLRTQCGVVGQRVDRDRRPEEEVRHSC
eukprot:111310-Pelagomonas_calceolata.AAC.2